MAVSPEAIGLPGCWQVIAVQRESLDSGEPETEENLALMRWLGELHLEHPVYGNRKLTSCLRRGGFGDQSQAGGAIAAFDGDCGDPRQAQNESARAGSPDLTVSIARFDGNRAGPGLVCRYRLCAHVRGFMYLVAAVDWWSRYVLGWRLSNTLEAAFCVDAWEAASRAGRQSPLIANTDRGAQFTSPQFIDAVESAGMDVSMDGRGRWMDNRFVERLWRSAKYEDIYLHDYGDGLAAGRGLGRWFDGHNQERPHQALGYATPAEVYFDSGAHGTQPASWEAMRPQESKVARKT